MKQTLFVASGAAIGLLAALVAVTCSKSDLMTRAEAQSASPEGTQSNGNMIMGIGGSTNNQNDLCWVLLKDRGKTRQGDYDRYSLSLYKANGQGVFDLTDMREVSFDGKLIQLNHPGHNKDLTPQNIKKKIDEQHRQEEQQQQLDDHPRVQRDVTGATIAVTDGGDDKGKVQGGGDFTQEVAGAEPVLQIDVAGKKCGLEAVGRGSHHRGEVRR